MSRHSAKPTFLQAIHLMVPMANWTIASKRVDHTAQYASQLNCHFESTFREVPAIAGQSDLTSLPFYEPARLYEIRTDLPVGDSRFELVGTLDHMAMESQVLVRPLGDHLIPDSYESDDGGCDHCRKRRRRRTTYLLMEHSGSLLRVGSSCLLDFLGPDGCSLLQWRWELQELTERRDEAVPGIDRLYRTEDILALTLAVIRRHGSVAIAQSTPDTPCTRDLVTALLSETLPDGWMQEDVQQVAIADSSDLIIGDHAMAQTIVMWAEQTRVDSHYMHRLRAACLQDIAPLSLVGILASAVALYLRTQRDAITITAPELCNEPAGDPGSTVVAIGRVSRATPAEGPFGLVHVCQLKDEAGHQIKWFSDKAIALGKHIEIIGEVKRIDTYRGRISTVVHHEKITVLDRAIRHRTSPS